MKFKRNIKEEKKINIHNQLTDINSLRAKK
jgi:hypothetical protein